MFLWFSFYVILMLKMVHVVWFPSYVVLMLEMVHVVMVLILCGYKIGSGKCSYGFPFMWF